MRRSHLSQVVLLHLALLYFSASRLASSSLFVTFSFNINAPNKYYAIIAFSLCLLQLDMTGICYIIALISNYANGWRMEIQDKLKEIVALKRVWGEVASAEALSLIRDDGVNPNTADDKNGLSALMRMASQGLNHDINEIVSLGADLNQQDNGGNTAVMFAIHFAKVDTLALLLKLGADPSVMNSHGFIALELVDRSLFADEDEKSSMKKMLSKKEVN